MLIITKIIDKQTKKDLPYTFKWYEGSFIFTFYDTDTKETFSRSLNQYRAKQFFESRSILQPDNLYVTIPKQCIKLADYLDYRGTWNSSDLSAEIANQLNNQSLKVDDIYISPNIQDYVNYSAVINNFSLCYMIFDALCSHSKLQVDYISDSIGLYLAVTDNHYVQNWLISILEALFSLDFIRIKNSIFISGKDNVVYEYVIENEQAFDLLYTKIKCMGVTRCPFSVQIL